MKSLLTDKLPQAFLALLGLSALLLTGCIADNPEDTDLPWSSSRGWEGIAPIAPQIMDRYE